MLAYVLKKLNDQYDYGLKLILLSVDEGITGYRDDSLEVHVKRQKNHIFISDTIIIVTMETLILSSKQL